MQGMLFAVTSWMRRFGSGAFRVPCDCVLEAISLSAANANGGIAEVTINNIVLWSGVTPENGAVTWLDRADWFADWTVLHGSIARLKARDTVRWEIQFDDVEPEDIMTVLYFREG